MYRILHVGLGPLGQRIIHDLYDRGLGRVVAAVDVSPDLAGKPLSSIVRTVTDDVTVMNDLEDFCGWGDIDAAIVTTASDLRLCADTFCRLLGHGVTTVSTCEELVWPWLRHKDLAGELHDKALRHKGRLLGTGVNPGAMMDTIPVFATAVCRKVRSVEVHRIQDASPRRVPFQKKIGAGLSESAFQQGVKDGWLRHVGLGESLHFVAHYLGLRLDDWHETIEMVRAEKDLSCTLGPIPKGHAAGVRQVAKGLAHGKTLVTMIFQAAIGQPDPQDRVLVDGEPRLDVVYRGGVHGDIATSAMTLNSIGPLLHAKPGLHTMATIPLPHWTAHATPTRAPAAATV